MCHLQGRYPCNWTAQNNHKGHFQEIYSSSSLTCSKQFHAWCFSYFHWMRSNPPRNLYVRIMHCAHRYDSRTRAEASSKTTASHDDVIKWKHFPRYWPFVREIHRSPVNFPHKGQWRGALMFALIYVWINGWVNNREAGDLRRNHTHYDVMVMVCQIQVYIYVMFVLLGYTAALLCLRPVKNNKYSMRIHTNGMGTHNSASGFE